MNDVTQHIRPAPKRPRWGWLAWEATVGYISQYHSPDATLKIEVYPGKHIVNWAASLTWGGNTEEVRDCLSLAEVLSSLWSEVEKHQDLFHSFDAAVRRPTNYADDDWLDEHTYEGLSRLIHVTDTVFQGDWLIVIVYRPVDEPDQRLKTRLIAEHIEVNRGGNGATLRNACRDLYHKAAPIYQKYRHKDDE
ncbi:MAG: hypothetical protein Q9P01_14680 [Anaerolineae bacterium]|nr:hypothetical protein [Anaerolineae bacterium]MDQ7036027.1 hypothetical protein [Anaerolineae bacterium]